MADLNGAGSKLLRFLVFAVSLLPMLVHPPSLFPAIVPYCIFIPTGTVEDCQFWLRLRGQRKRRDKAKGPEGWER